MSLRTRYEFTLPRGYVDREGAVHRTGVMRLATARDELEPLRDPMVTGPDDPRLTIVVLARVVEQLGTLELVSSHEIENLFAADLAYLQDFYGVINFGTQAEFDAFLAEQEEQGPAVGHQSERSDSAAAEADAQPAGDDAASGVAARGAREYVSSRRSAIEEIPAETR